MSHEDPYRPNTGRDRGAYTPPTDDDLPFDRQSYDPRRPRGGGNGGGGGKAPPVTLIVSALVLLAIIVGIAVLFSMDGLSPSEDAPPAVGTVVGEMKAAPPIDAQPVDPAAGIDVYDTAEAVPTTPPTFTAPPEEVQPRPAPRPLDAAPPTVRPAPAPATRPATPPAETRPATPAATGGSASVQIGAFSTPGIAETQYNAVVGRHSRFTQGGSRRIQEVQSSSGTTLYRTSVAGLSRDQATGLCNAIKASGGDCIVR
ncbi:SPOR domain-containing protein [Brevundimonas sp.]